MKLTFNRDGEWNFVVSTSALIWGYTTKVVDAQDLLDNPWKAERLYWEQVDSIKETTALILNCKE